MVSLILSLALTAGFDAGGCIGAAFPGSGLQRSHQFAGLFGALAGWSSGPSRVGLNYGFAEFNAPQAAAYRMQLHSVSIEYGFEFVHRPGWGIAAQAGAGYGLARRIAGSAVERGGAPAAHFGVGFNQRQGASRLSLGLDNAVYLESGGAGIKPTYIFGLRVGVGYAL